MKRLLDRLQSLAGELRRRRVHRVAGVYAVTLFVLLQIADATFGPLGIPDVWVAVLISVMVGGFPLALVLAWTLDITDHGIQPSPPGPLSGFFGGTPLRRSLTVTGAVVAGGMLGWGTWEVFRPGPDGESAGAQEATGATLDPRHIAVLYLDDHSQDASLGWLAAEVTEGLLHQLGTVEGLHVAARQAVKPFQGQPVPMDSIVRALGVGSVVEGSVTRAGNRVRATLQLIDGATLTHLDSRQVEGTLDDPFAFQDSVSSYVARTLRQRLGQEIRIRSAQAGTTDVEAWTAFARGREELDRFYLLRAGDPAAAERSLQRADSLFAEARSLDPAWPAPLHQRAVALGGLASLRGPLPGALDPSFAASADSLLAEAISQDPDFSDALGYRGWLRARLARNPEVTGAGELLTLAEADLRAAVNIDPENAAAWWTLSEVMVRKARFAEAVEAAQTALEADAFLEVEEESLHSLYYSVSQLGPVDEAVNLCNEGRRKFPGSPNFIACRFYLLGSYPQVPPDVANARALLDSLVESSPVSARETWRTYGTVWLARVLARAGQREEARAMLDGVRPPGETPPELAYDEAHVQLLMGDQAEAVRLLSLYLTIDPDTAFIREDWWFEDLRDYRPFRQLVGAEGAAP